MIQALEEGRLIAVSDASVSAEGFASHAYTIVSTDEKERIHGSAPVDCDEDDVESTRAEKAGILASLTIINVLESLSSTPIKSIQIYCDNLDAVTKRTRPSHLQSFVKFIGANYDLDKEINQMIKNITTEIKMVHVDGHQDNDKDFNYDSAPLDVRLNIDMDAVAKQFLKENQGSMAPNGITPFYPASKTALSIHGSTITNNLNEHIKMHKNGPKTEMRLVQKGIISAKHMHWIQWRGLERSMKRKRTIKKIPVF